MIKKTRLLITDTAPLYPPRWGGPKRIWGLFSNFTQELFDITYVGVDCTLAGNKKYDFNKLQNNFKQISCSFPVHYYPWHIIEKSIIKNPSLDLFAYLRMHTDWHFKQILNSQKTDILICSHPWSSRAIAKTNSSILIYDAHNCEYLLMEQILKNHFLKRLILRQVKSLEGRLCQRSDIILACSEKEKEDFIGLYGVDPAKIVIVPNGTNLEKNDTKTKPACRKDLFLPIDDKVIIFVGSYYKPNIDAARFIIRKVSGELPEFKFLIVGGASEAFKTQVVPPNIKLLGRVSEEGLTTALRASDLAINPMFDGSGVNIKMLDYMAYGLPIVTTECGARGIEIKDRQPMLISSVEKFSGDIKRISFDNALYKKMSEDAQALVVKHYGWKIISNRLEEIILEKIRNN